jgi:hypothetical protein
VYERYLGILFTLSFCHRVFSCSNDILNLKLRLLVFGALKLNSYCSLFLCLVLLLFFVILRRAY